MVDFLIMAEIKIRVGPGGRLVIPSQFRKELGINEGDSLIATLEDGELRLLALHQAVKRAQQTIRRYSKGRSLAGELVQARQKEEDE